MWNGMAQDRHNRKGWEKPFPIIKHIFKILETNTRVELVVISLTMY